MGKKEVAVRVETSRVEWGPVFAGALAAAALSFVLLSAAASLGLSYPGHSEPGTGGTIAALWSLVVTVGSFLLGGYIAGRLGAPRREARADEVSFRDGMHGFLAWSIAILIGAVLLLLVAVTTAQVSAQAGSSAAAQSDSGLAPATDTLLRASPTLSALAPLERDEVARVLAASVANGQMSANDRSYLAQAVAQRAGLSAADAEKRVDTAFADAQHTVEAARKAAAQTGLLTASALLLGLAAAWYGAQRGAARP